MGEVEVFLVYFLRSKVWFRLSVWHYGLAQSCNVE